MSRGEEEKRREVEAVCSMRLFEQILIVFFLNIAKQLDFFLTEFSENHYCGLAHGLGIGSKPLTVLNNIENIDHFNSSRGNLFFLPKTSLVVPKNGQHYICYPDTMPISFSHQHVIAINLSES